MQRIRVCGRALIALVAIQSLAFAQADPVTEERTRTFPERMCRFTLPNSDWQWREVDDPQFLFQAVHPDGISVNLLTMHLPQAQIGEDFVRGFDGSYFKPGQLEKRGGKLGTFAGVACYEAKGRQGNFTAVAQVFAAHGYIYNLNIVGGGQPVEDSPAFPELLRGFEFTVPPAPTLPVENAMGRPIVDPEREKSRKLAEAMGRVCGMCLMGALLLWVVSRLSRKGNKPVRKSPAKKTQSESIFLEDDE
jgi:hypothetical protein